MTNATLRGKPDAENPHVRFDEGEVASAKPRRGSLLYTVSKVSLVVALSVGSALCLKATTWIGEGNVTWKDVPADESATAPVVTGANGLLYKTGTGCWTLPSSFLSGTTLPLAVSVLEGTVSFDGAAPAAEANTPPTVAQAAYLWLDASQTARLLDGSGAAVASGAVEKWCDVRETTPGTTAQYGFAKAMYNMPDHKRSDATALAPELTTYEGKSALYFGGTTSGRWMQWCTAQGADAADTVPIKNIFAVHGVATSFG